MAIANGWRVRAAVSPAEAMKAEMWATTTKSSNHSMDSRAM